ncbi:MAG TPA: SDR family oxidoreductase [Bryobacteraceae bacterium]|jgi:NAD(P)-dependent dehydrogenase (short-subunit alcohol dehydrogenase family)
MRALAARRADQRRAGRPVGCRAAGTTSRPLTGNCCGLDEAGPADLHELPLLRDLLTDELWRLATDGVLGTVRDHTQPGDTVKLGGAVAVVTGGGTGIGRAVCLALARAGAGGVVVNYSRSAADAEELVAELGDLGCAAMAERADVADDAQVRAMAGRVTDRFHRVDVLVNNSGMTRATPHEDLDGLTDEVWHEVLSVNLLGAFHCARSFAPALKRARGSVINVASISGYRAGGSSIAYGVSKAALLQLTRNLAVALAPNVRVNAVAPGTVSTRLQTTLHGEQGFAERARRERQSVPLQRTAGPEDVAEVVLGLLGMDMVTGEAVIIDGGKHVVY